MKLPEHVENRYIYVLLIAERAKKIIQGIPKLIETEEKDPISIAKEEVKRGYITYFSPSEAKKKVEEIVDSQKEGKEETGSDG